jgi:hypothetical protein
LCFETEVFQSNIKKALDLKLQELKFLKQEFLFCNSYASQVRLLESIARIEAHVEAISWVLEK